MRLRPSCVAPDWGQCDDDGRQGRHRRDSLPSNLNQANRHSVLRVNTTVGPTFAVSSRGAEPVNRSETPGSRD